jgi:hypothetical protein
MGMSSLEGVLLLEVFLCVLAFAVAVSYRFRRNSPTYDPKKKRQVPTL